MGKKTIISIISVLVLSFGAVAWAMGDSTNVSQEAVISGNVTQTVAAGQEVTSGTSLVDISTLTGTTSAARATVNGVVKQVLVKPGDTVHPGEVVVYIEAK